jgi:hypothetical protein
MQKWRRGAGVSLVSYLKVRAAYGALIHLLPHGTMQALCGFDPKEARAGAGGRWFQQTDQTKPATCKMCLTRLAMEQADER